MNGFRAVFQHPDFFRQLLPFPVSHPAAGTGLNVRDDVAFVHDRKQGDALHHIAVGFTGAAQAGAARHQRHQSAVADGKGIFKIRPMEKWINRNIFDVLCPDGLLQGFQLIAVSGEQKEHIRIILQSPDSGQNGLHVLHGAHIAEIGHGKPILGDVPEGILLPVLVQHALILVPVGNHVDSLRREIPVGTDVILHLPGQSHNPVGALADAAVDVVHQTADGVLFSQGAGDGSHLRIQIIADENQLGAKKCLGPGGNPGQNWRIGIDHHTAIAGKPRQIQQHHKGKGKIIENPTQKAGTIQLEIFQPPDENPLHRLRLGNVLPVRVLSGVAAEHLHGKACLMQSLGGIEGQHRRGNILGVKKLAQKQNILFHAPPSVSAMDCSKPTML